MAALKEPEIPTLKTIEAALKLIDAKKENLKKAYDDLQVQAGSLLLPSFSLSLSWTEIDSHFTSLQSTLTHRFHLLQSIDTSLSSSDERVDSVSTCNELGIRNFSQDVSLDDPSPSSAHPSHDRVESGGIRHNVASSPTRESVRKLDTFESDLMTLCEKMDGEGLRNYMNKNAYQRANTLQQLSGAMRVAPDQGAMILDGLGGFYSANTSPRGDRDGKLCRLRRTCLDLLEAMIKNKPTLSDEVKERAKRMASEWKEKASLNGGNTMGALGFLQLLVAYQLENEFDKAELVDFFVVAAKFNQAVALCRAIGLGGRTADLIQKLIDNDKQLLAVKFIFEFGLIDKFQPVPLLRAYMEHCKNFTEKVCEDGKNSVKIQNEARSREVNALKSVLKIIDEHKLGSQYPPMDLEKRIEMLEKTKADSKQPAPSPDNKPQQAKKQEMGKKRPKKLQPAGNKRLRKIVTNGPATLPVITASSSTIPPFRQSHFQHAGLLTGPGLYGIVDPTSSAPNFAGSSATLYGSAGAAVPFPGASGPAGAHIGIPEPQMPSSYYDGYGGYGLPPQYHPAYYPH